MTENYALDRPRSVIMMKTIHVMFMAMVVALAFSGCAARPQPRMTEITHEYRLRSVPTFEKPVELLVQHDVTGATTLSEFSYSGMGGYSPKRKTTPKVFVITKAQWDAFTLSFSRQKPWGIAEQKRDQLGAPDGCGVTLTLREGARRKEIYRWSPWMFESETRVVNVINEIVRLSARRELHAGWLSE